MAAKEHMKWLRANGHSTAPLTGTDARALDAIAASDGTAFGRVRAFLSGGLCRTVETRATCAHCRGAMAALEALNDAEAGAVVTAGLLTTLEQAARDAFGAWCDSEDELEHRRTMKALGAAVGESD